MGSRYRKASSWPAYGNRMEKKLKTICSKVADQVSFRPLRGKGKNRGDRGHLVHAPSPYIVFGVLLQRLDRGALDGAAAEPYRRLDDDGGAHDCEDDVWYVGCLVRGIEYPTYGFDQDLEEGRDHED